MAELMRRTGDAASARGRTGAAIPGPVRPVHPVRTPSSRPLWTVEPATWTILLHPGFWIQQDGPCCADLGRVGRPGSPQWTSTASGISQLRRVTPEQVTPGSSCHDAAPPHGWPRKWHKLLCQGTAARAVYIILNT